MKKFKINKFEKFVISHNNTIVIVLAVCYFLSIFFVSIGDSNGFSFTWGISFGNLDILSFLLFFILLMCTKMLPEIKNIQLVRMFQNDLNLIGATEGTIMLLEAMPPKSKPQIALLCNNRIAYLIEMGEREKAEQEVRLFWQTFDPRKLSPLVMFSLHTNMANIMASKDDRKGFDEQVRLVYAYWNKMSKAYKKVNEKDFINFQLFVKSYTVVDPNFEAEVMTSLQFKPNGKPVKNIAPYRFLSAYSTLFDYFKKTGDKEKMKYYAQLILNTGNNQFEAYRTAKDFLQNENTVN